MNLEIASKGLIWGAGTLSAPDQSYSVLRRHGTRKQWLHFETIKVIGFTKPAWKIVAKVTGTDEVVWQRPFDDKAQCGIAWAQIIGVDLSDIPAGAPINLPMRWVDAELTFYIFTYQPYTATTTNTAVWTSGGITCPTGVTLTDYLVIAQGGGGGANAGGGGGAGGMRSAQNFSVTAGNTYTTTVGVGPTAGAGGTGQSSGTNGANSVWGSITSTGGGGGGGGSGAAGSSGGSGGGGGSNNGQGAGGAASPAGQGNAGGQGAASSNGGGGGGGAGSTGSAGSGTVGGNGGTGLASTISGASITYAGGGGGGGDTAGTGGSSVGGNGSTGTADAFAGATNKGGGGGGSRGSGQVGNGGAGGSGFIALSFTASSTSIRFTFNMPMLGM